MIRIITTRKEKEAFIPECNVRFIKEYLNGEQLDFQILEDCDSPYISSDDIVLVQTRDIRVLDIIRNSNARTTVESQFTIKIANDKNANKDILEKYGILCPKTIRLEDVVDGRMYFVKPNNGENSLCISENSICKTKDDVFNQVDKISSLGHKPLIEEFIDGIDCTTAVIFNRLTNNVETYSIMIHVDSCSGIQTRELKMNTEEICTPIHNKEMEDFAVRAYNAIGCTTYMRVDFRLSNVGVPYLIDINLYPGLGPIDHFAKCLGLCANFSYSDILRKILSTAKRL